ncbi:putative carboxylesterase [Abeliophyllum distichum]|uniref:Carboxylesterase n=1 Tax=Abeliophyllum distichum TaxID=126358 RepID=A0ABD1RUL7_9LAMI
MDQNPKLWPAMAGYSILLFLCLCQPWPAVNCQHTWQEAFTSLGISYNSNGTLDRQIQIPMVNATPSVDPNQPTLVTLSTDVRISPLNKAFVRLYRPVNSSANTKLPVIVYLHGGDFVLFSATTVIFHNFCNSIAAQFPAIVVSVEYRLAPENRLPAAYNDALNAIFWLQSQAIGFSGRHPWFKYADFSRVFLLGSSAGANIVYHTALRTLDFNIKPLKIRGVLLNQAFFGGIQNTSSELRLLDDAYAPLYVCDVLWTLALPTYANKDHEFCNPLTGGSYLGRVPRLPRFFVKGNEGDPLVDRSKQLVQLLQAYKVPVVSKFDEGGYHGIELSNTTAATELYTAMKNFIDSTGFTEHENSHASI